ncbi:MAG: hypothetical protein WA624_13465 [Methylocella sp.]
MRICKVTTKRTTYEVETGCGGRERPLAAWLQNRESDNTIQTGPAAFKSQKGAIAFAQTTAGLACILTAGCAFGPDFVDLVTPDVTEYTKEPLKASSASAGSGLDQGQRFVQELDIPGQWWTTFHSRPLNDLIEDALKHNPDPRTAEATLRVAYQTAEAQYRSTVITAFQNVADSLRAIQADARELKASVHAEEAALKSLDIVRKQAELGQVKSLAILNAQQTYLTALLTRVQAQAAAGGRVEIPSR